MCSVKASFSPPPWTTRLAPLTKRGQVARQPDHGVADVGRLGHPAERARSQRPRRRPSGRRTSPRTPRCAPCRPTRVDPHLRRPLHGEGLGEVDRARPWPRRRPRCRATAACPTGSTRSRSRRRRLLLHHRVGGLGDVQRGGQVERDDLLAEPGRRAGGVGAAASRRRCSPRCRAGRAARRSRRPGRATCSGSRTSAATNSTSSGSDAGVRLGPAAHDDRRAGGEQPVGDAAADAPRAAR